MPYLRDSLVAAAVGFVAVTYAYADGSTTPVLTRGRGVPICDAYLERLKLAEYTDPPYCDRPESQEIEGFELLNRIPLAADEAFSLANKVYNFTHQGNQDSFPNGRSFISKEEIQRDLGQSIVAWRYDPPVDVNNDSTPDPVVIWQGHGASQGSYVCGFVKERDPWWQNQLAYIVDFSAMRIDERRTKEIFGHPAGKYSITVDGKLVDLPGFLPVGLRIGIFKYRGLYYFDTFFDSYGDFQGLRQRDARIGSTLGVFLRSKGTTKQVCEYRWTKLQR